MSKAQDEGELSVHWVQRFLKFMEFEGKDEVGDVRKIEVDFCR